MRLKLSNIKARALQVGLKVDSYHGRYSIGLSGDYFVDYTNYSGSLKEADAYISGYASLYYNQQMINELAKEANDAK